MALWRPVRWRPFTWIKGTLILVTVIGVLVLFADRHGNAMVTDDRTTYVCYQGRCITKATLGEATANTTSFQSMENCRLLCGRFGNLWPMPSVSGELGNQLVSVTPENMKLSLRSNNGAQVNEYLEQVFEIYKDTISKECGSSPVRWTKLPVTFHFWIQQESLVLNKSTSEQYELDVRTGSDGIEVDIKADTVYGARHGLETCSQLSSRWRDRDQDNCNVYMMTSATIKDKPLYRHRGILVDTARNFIPLKDLKRTVDGMGANKLNVLHWHATDSHSFPLHLSTVPQLAELGSYSPEEIYREEEIKDFVQYAKLRGVRIFMEIDSPSHTGNGWQFGEKMGLGNLILCRNREPWVSACGQPPCGQLNPVNDNVYKVLGDLYKGIQNLVPSEDMFHMGGDEVQFECWNETEEIIDYMKKQKYARNPDGFKKLWSEFHQKALKAWDKAIGHSNTKIVLWTSDLTNPFTIEQSLDKNRFIIETWADQYDRVPTDLLQKGYEMIFASTDVLYLDHGFWGGTTYHTWRHIYDYRIPDGPNVLGGEVALWTEYADTNSLDNRIWPRAAALAERLWSSPSISSTESQYRLYEMRQRLIRRGIKADQVIPQWCYLNEGLC